MTWNYRVLRHPDGHLALHEVYYDKTGKPVNYTVNPVSFAVDEDEGLHGLTAFLELALRDAKERPILDVSEFRPKPESARKYPIRNAHRERRAARMKKREFYDGEEKKLIAAYERGETHPVKDQKSAKKIVRAAARRYKQTRRKRPL
jgi:hypothetical protein